MKILKVKSTTYILHQLRKVKYVKGVVALENCKITIVSPFYHDWERLSAAEFPVILKLAHDTKTICR